MTAGMVLPCFGRGDIDGDVTAAAEDTGGANGAN